MFKIKSYTLLFLVAFALIYYSFLSGDKATLIFNLRDTHYVISRVHFYEFQAAFVLGLAIVYLIFDLARIPLFSILNVIHIYGTCILFLVMMFYYYQSAMSLPSKNNDYEFNPTEYDAYAIITLLAIIFLQILFIINIFVSFVKCAYRIFIKK